MIDWNEKLEIVLSAISIYAFIVLFVRLYGKRTTAQMNNFDWIVTVAFGSLASSGILMSKVSILDAVLAMFVLLTLQYSVTFLAFRNARFAEIVKSEPRILFYDGKFLKRQMKKERVTEAEILSAIRQHGFARVEDVQAVVLENEAQMSVLSYSEEQSSSALQDIEPIER